MLKIYGLAALSEFRLARLLATLQKIEPDILAIDAQFVHFIDLLSPLDAEDREKLENLLHYGERVPDISRDAALPYLVTPRPGTLSPWSSKATEIVHRCGLDNVKRIERGVLYTLSLKSGQKLTSISGEQILPVLHDRMTQTVFPAGEEPVLFAEQQSQPLQHVAVMEQGLLAMQTANVELGLALSDEEKEYLTDSFKQLGRNPTDVELMMFAQANSEHCRHKIFNASWRLDGEDRSETLFGMIRQTAEKYPQGILSAYSDNASVVAGNSAKVMMRDPLTREYGYIVEEAHLLMKVETHNHPTAISPYPGAATGSGGEIRDEGATGRGSQSKAGLTGFTVSNLKIPGFEQPWETDFGKPERVASALEIMLEGPLGGAAFNNEFGRPNLAGYFRSFEQPAPGADEYQLLGYHKPIMIAGGMGNIRPMLTDKKPIPEGALIIILGGPAMLIGLGGGAASSQTSGKASEALDFASVQRENPEMERRCQEVINHCNAMGEQTPILSIHDIGAGGLSNAVPEIIHDSGRGGRFELREIPNADPGMSPLQIWCNEAQERYVVAIKPESLEQFEGFCRREHCLYAVIGNVTMEQDLLLTDRLLGPSPVDIPMSLLFGKPPKMQRDVERVSRKLEAIELNGIHIQEAVKRVLAFPAVADKSFLIHIGDRSVTGLVVRDQMVGPWQIPVADVAVTASGFSALTGEAMAIGERSPLAVIDAPASGRMAIGEALTNLAAASIGSLQDVKLSANWMAAAGSPGEDAALYDTVEAVSLGLCHSLGIAIPVGKDSLSMKSVWQEQGREKLMTSPLSLIITAFAPVNDVGRTLTPVLQQTDSRIILVDLGGGKNRLGGSTLAQAYGQMGNDCPDVDDSTALKSFFSAIQILNRSKLLLAYHDRSDGGLLATLSEMLFAGRVGISINTETLGDNQLAALFNEELGAVIQVRDNDVDPVMAVFEQENLGELVHVIGQTTDDQNLTVQAGSTMVFTAQRSELQQIWSETSYRMQALRDNPECARQEYESIADDDDPGLHSVLSYDVDEDICAPLVKRIRPKLAVFREQGINGHIEMAAAFDAAGFACIDVHMNDVISGRDDLSGYSGLAVCGGFSYGDVLGAGGGWAKSILFNQNIREIFQQFFHREDTFGLGVCNGCQMLSHLQPLIPGTEGWPRFVRNVSEQFEARVAMVEVQRSPSILFAGMEGSRMPVAVAHGEGRAEFSVDPGRTLAEKRVVLNYVDNYGNLCEDFPANPNGSPFGITGLTNADGRFTIMMPHPERCFRSLQNSWYPADWKEYGAWMRMFRNARAWVG